MARWRVDIIRKRAEHLGTVEASTIPTLTIGLLSPSSDQALRGHTIISMSHSAFTEYQITPCTGRARKCVPF
jgi:hypothetical protein